jgi:hypothetical protein
MKRILMICLIVVVGAGLSLAQLSVSTTEKPTTTEKPAATEKPTTPKKAAKTQKVTTKIFTGKVESVTIGDPTKGTKSEIVVVGRKEKKNTFVVTDATKIYDQEKKEITLDKLMKDDKVKVKYCVTKEGNEAKEISVQKATTAPAPSPKK